jgi:1-acyl-sn-glycerol-3-phosphate acyltransferase
VEAFGVFREGIRKLLGQFTPLLAAGKVVHLFPEGTEHRGNLLEFLSDALLVLKLRDSAGGRTSLVFPLVPVFHSTRH